MPGDGLSCFAPKVANGQKRSFLRPVLERSQAFGGVRVRISSLVPGTKF
jgi:hypothetical protein